MKTELITRMLLILSIEHISLIKKASSSDGNESGYGKGCYYNGKYHLTSWEEGCNYICFCNNTETGYFQCHRRCPVYKNLPSDCILELPPDEPCCKVPVCKNQTTTTVSTQSEQQDSQVQNTTGAYSLSKGESALQRISNPADVNINSPSNIDNQNLITSADVSKDVTKSEKKYTRTHQQSDNIDFTFDLSQFAFDTPVTTTEQSVPDSSSSQDGASGDVESNVSDLKNMLSIEEINPIDLASVHDIIFDIPSTEETLQSDIGDNQPGNNNMDDGMVVQNTHDNNDSIKPESNDSKHVTKLSISREIPPEIFPLDAPSVGLKSKGVLNTTFNEPVLKHMLSNEIQIKMSENNNVTLKDTNEHIEPLSNKPKHRVDINQTINTQTVHEKHGINISDVTDKMLAKIEGLDIQPKRIDGVFDEDKHTRRHVSSTISPITTAKSMVNKIMRIDKSIETHGARRTGFQGWSLLRQRSKLHSSLPQPGRRCVYMGMRFNTKQTWFDGCNQICVCLDAKTGFFKCTERCPLYKTVPQGCEMKRSSVECCPLPDCSNSTKQEPITTVTRRPMTIADRFNRRASGGTQSSQFIGQFNGGNVKPLTPATKLYILTQLDPKGGGRHSSKEKKSLTGIIVHTATGLYRLSEASGENRERQGELKSVLTGNRSSTSNKTRVKGEDKTPAPFQTILGLCQYAGKRYRPGDTWEIGCSLLCECLQGIQGQYACRRRCKQYPVIPFGCSLQLPPNEPCCKTIQCGSRNIHKTSTESQNQRYVKELNPRQGRLVIKKSIDNRPVRNRSNFLPTRLFKRSNSSQLSPIGNSSLMAFSRQVNTPFSKVENDSNLKKTNFSKENASAHIELTHLPSDDIMFSQTGAVLNSKSGDGKTSQIQAATTGCIVGDKVYRRGQSWKIGCKLRCFCADEVKRTMSCNRLCPNWQLPTECKLENPSKGKCCPVPKCPEGYFIKYPHGYIPL